MKKDKIQKPVEMENRPVAQSDWDWPMHTINMLQADPLGMYTGIPEDRAFFPIKDVHDI